MYDAGDDPYCYKGTAILKNKLCLHDQAQLDAFEAEISAQRAEEPLPEGGLDQAHYLAIHRYLFQNIYTWAGRIRTVRLFKDETPFCFPENIETELRRVFTWLADEGFLRGLPPADFAAKAAQFLAELNAIHPFREGNGRAQNNFLILLAERAGHPLDMERLDPPAFLAAMIASFHKNEAPLALAI